MKRPARFEGAGLEGMLDVMLGCMLIFLLMAGLVNFEQGVAQEVTLPSIELSKLPVGGSGAMNTRRIAVSLAMEGGEPTVWIEEERVPLARLQSRLAERGDGVVHVALRRATDVPCSVEDEVMIACRDAGIRQVAIVVETLGHDLAENAR